MIRTTEATGEVLVDAWRGLRPFMYPATLHWCCLQMHVWPPVGTECHHEAGVVHKRLMLQR